MTIKAVTGGFCAALLCLTLGACSSGDGQASDAPSGSSTDSAPATGPNGSDTAHPDDSPTGTATLPPPVAAPSGVPTVERPNAAPTRQNASPAPAASPVSYGDGVSVSVTSMKRTTITGAGPGVMPGAPLLVVSLSIHNASQTPVDVNSVVVSATYGEPAMQAAGAYNDETHDFTGAVAPGADGSAVYAFTVPADAGDGVKVVVDFDGLHSPAVFTGTRG